MTTTKQMSTPTGGASMFRRAPLEAPNTDTGGGAAAPATTDGAAEALIASAVAKAMEPMAKAIADMNAARATETKQKATNNMGGLPTTREGDAPAPDVRVGKSAVLPEGVRAARIIKAHMLAKMRGVQAVEILEQQGYREEKAALVKGLEDVARQRALGQNVFADGGALVPVEYSTEIINLLRNKTVVRTLGARAIPMGASLEIPEQTQAATAFYVGENAAVAPSQQKVGGMRLTEKKLMALVPISNDLIRNASIGAEAFVRDDLVQVMALKEDYTAIFGTGGEFAPRGIVSLTDAANQYAQTAVSPLAPTLAEVKKELAKAKRKLKTGNIPMTRLGWIISPRTEEYLYSITDGNGNSVFQAALDAGTLHGQPLMVTNQIPENLGGTTDESRIILGDFDQFIIGESLNMEVEAFPNASYDSTGAGAIVSGISSDQSVVRSIQKHDFGLRYRASFVVVAVRWGA